MHRADVLSTSEYGGIFSLKYKMTTVQMGRDRGSLFYTRVKTENQNHRNSLYIAASQDKQDNNFKAVTQSKEEGSSELVL